MEKLKFKNEIETILKHTQEELLVFLEHFLSINKFPQTVTKDYIYAQGDIPVMVVAHLDTVHKAPPTEIYYSKDLTTLISPTGIGGDDRAGVFIIMELILKGFRPHILFTCDEEIGGLGAQKFVDDFRDNKLDLKYILEFDRRGSDDCVFYDCDNKEFTNYITSFGFTEQYGTFSDISIIAPSLSVAAVNLSSGYYRAHTNEEYIKLEDIAAIIEKTTYILNDLENAQSFKYIPALPRKYLSSFGSIYSMDDYKNYYSEDWYYYNDGRNYYEADDMCDIYELCLEDYYFSGYFLDPETAGYLLYSDCLDNLSHKKLMRLNAQYHTVIDIEGDLVNANIEDFFIDNDRTVYQMIADVNDYPVVVPCQCYAYLKSNYGRIKFQSKKAMKVYVADIENMIL